MELKYKQPDGTIVPCTFHGVDPDGKILIQIPDPYDPGRLQKAVEPATVIGLDGIYRPAVVWAGKM